MSKLVKILSKSAVLHGPFNINIEGVNISAPKDFEVLIEVKAVGICGSDIHYYEEGKIGTKEVKNPITLGHELSGIVIGIGKKVTKFEIGDRVVVEPGIPCQFCKFCKQDNYNLCGNIKFLSSPPVDGAFTQYIKHDEAYTFKIPDELSFEAATLVEPLSVGLHGLKNIEANNKSHLLILGVGPVGLSAIIAAKGLGIKNIIVTDIVEYRLQIAKKLGADYIFNVKEKNLNKKIINSVDGVDIVLDTTGNESALNLGLSVLEKGGRISSIGFPADTHLNVDFSKIIQKEIEIKGVYRYRNNFKQSIQILSDHKFYLSDIITHQYKLEDTRDALEFTRLNKDTCIKTIIYPNN